MNGILKRERKRETQREREFGMCGMNGWYCMDGCYGM
jgi:hypothetical protein